MAALPDAVKQLAENVQWTTDLGNAFLAQQSDVMDAVQRMRAKAQAAGNLKSGQQQKVETQTVEGKSVIVIQQANPQIVYVPAYNPVVVYGAPAYRYPPIAYPPGYGLLAFGAGVAIGAAWGNGGWGYGCAWGSSTTTTKVTINNNNNYVNNSYRKNASTLPASGGNSNWQHNPQHRGAAPYSNRATATKYSGANGTAGTLQTARGGSAVGVSTNYGNTAVGKTSSGNAYAVHNGNVYSSSGNASKSGAGNAAASRPSGGASTRPAGGGGGDSVGGRSVSSGGSRGGGDAFGGGGGRGGGNSARASSNRGGQSMGGGGFSRGGGGRGGGGRGR